MNRILLIGNGFDLAHGLNTKYADFIDDYWEKKTELFIKSYQEGRLSFRSQGNRPIYDYDDNDITITNLEYIPGLHIIDEPERKGYDRFKTLSMRMPATQARAFIFKNKLLEQITDKKKDIYYWVDIEEEYYDALYDCLNDKTGEKVKQLNGDFLMLKKELAKYLKTQSEIMIRKSGELNKKIYWCTHHDNPSHIPGQNVIDNFLYLTFNYTSTEKLYVAPANKIIHIHGELDNPKNPIIFGYGDEIGDKYKLLEDKNDKEYLKNIKSIKYTETRNYKEMLSFINSHCCPV